MFRYTLFPHGRTAPVLRTSSTLQRAPGRCPALWRLVVGLALGLLGLGTLLMPIRVHAVSLPPPPHQLALTLFAEGLQSYRSVEPTPGAFLWQFFGPEATLFTDSTQTTRVGIHFNVNTAPADTLTTCPVVGFACPSWQFDADSSAVTVGRPIDMTPSPNAIPELLLPAVSHVGTGLFSAITFVQRLDTVGGLATACALPTGLGQECDSPYTATYTFFVATPEPGTWLLLGSGLVGLLGYGWRRRQYGVVANPGRAGV
ncbi:MAG: DUF3455 domain-containing protein [Candidatus Tectimicrobiota bacterium]